MRKVLFKLVKKLFDKELHTDRDVFLRENFTCLSFLDLRDGIPYGAVAKTQSVLVEAKHAVLISIWAAQLLDAKDEARRLRRELIRQGQDLKDLKAKVIELHETLEHSCRCMDDAISSLEAADTGFIVRSWLRGEIQNIRAVLAKPNRSIENN